MNEHEQAAPSACCCRDHHRQSCPQSRFGWKVLGDEAGSYRCGCGFTSTVGDCSPSRQSPPAPSEGKDQVLLAWLRAVVGELDGDSLLTSADRLALERSECEGLDAGCETGEVAEAIRRSRTARINAHRADLLESLLHAAARVEEKPTGWHVDLATVCQHCGVASQGCCEHRAGCPNDARVEGR